MRVFCKQLSREDPSETHGQVTEPIDESPNPTYLDGAESGDSV